MRTIHGLIRSTGYACEMRTPLTLASGSPRRKALLAQLGIPFDVVVSDEPEPLLAGLTPREQAMQLAVRKARAVAQRVGGLVLGADTIVVLDGDIVGKPADAADAALILRRLRGREHEAITGLALLDAATAATHQIAVSSIIHMRDYSDAEIAAYIASGEPLDKAGAYGIQGQGGALVSRYSGCFNTIVGLPLCGVAMLLRDVGYPLPSPPACLWPDGTVCPGWPETEP